MKRVSYRPLLMLPVLALLLADGGCSNASGPSRDIVTSPRTPEQKQALQLRMQNDPTLHGKYQGAISAAGSGQAPPWMKHPKTGGTP